MKRPRSVLFVLSCLLSAPLMAQTTTQIGGGTCSSSTLSGTYAIAVTGRQVSAAGNFQSVFQANGFATFNGQSTINISLTAGTLQAVPATVMWTGNYSVQANCVGLITITGGGSATFNLALYADGSSGVASNFLITGSDSVYNYSGSGNTQPTGCSAATLTGVYTFTGTGYSLNGTSVNGIENGTGLLQFDGVSALTVNFNTSTLGKAPVALNLTGSYSISSNCLGSATVSDAAKANTYVMSFSITSAAAATGAFNATLAQSGKLLIAGTGNAAYGQPTTSSENQVGDDRPALELVAGASPETAAGRKL